MLAELTTVVESATVKGFPEMVALRRIALAPTELRSTSRPTKLIMSRNCSVKDTRSVLSATASTT
jgi:hypothetical protein